MDDRLRQFSPPPWAALGRRDPNQEQAPWRESSNVEDRRNAGFGDMVGAYADQLATFLTKRLPDDISAMGSRPASDEMMRRHMDDASARLPVSNVEIEDPHRLPYYVSSRADGGAVKPWQDDKAALYRDHIDKLGHSGVPRSQWPSYEAFLMELSGMADGGAVGPKQPSFAEPLSGFIDKVVGGVKDYGRNAMDQAGWSPWAKGAGELAMGVAATPFESVSSASKLGMAPFDWATGREVMATPWDVVGAVPLAAAGGAKVLRHALDVSDLRRSARAAEEFLDTKRSKGDFLPSDLRIKNMIQEMAQRRNMD